MEVNFKAMVGLSIVALVVFYYWVGLTSLDFRQELNFSDQYQKASDLCKGEFYCPLSAFFILLAWLSPIIMPLLFMIIAYRWVR